MSSHKWGDWDLTEKVLDQLTKLDLVFKAQLQEDGKLIVETMVGHIDSQDLGWSPLAEGTIAQKGNSQIYVETGWLRDNLEAIDLDDTTIYVGASPNKTHAPSGENFYDIMVYQEFGTSTQPARPLIRPTWTELEPIIKKNWNKILKDAMKK